MDKIIVGIAAALLGFASGLLVPWVKWEIEKRKHQRNRRETLITQWRQAIGIEPFDEIAFLQSREYSELRIHLSEDDAMAIESKRKIISLSTSRPNTMQNVLYDEVTRLEKEWGLV